MNAFEAQAAVMIEEAQFLGKEQTIFASINAMFLVLGVGMEGKVW